jgi:hypothetical protein
MANNNSNVNYKVAPTPTDNQSALMYAQMKLKREVCEGHADRGWAWLPDPVVGYPCPAGLTCESGTCTFTPDGCRAASQTDRYDCVRQAQPCVIDGKKQTCNVCVYDITSETQFKVPQVPPDQHAPGRCYPGNAKMPAPIPLKDSPDAETFKEPLCMGQRATPHPTPYLVGSSMVKCTTDADCTTSGLGGVCINAKSFPSADAAYLNACAFAPFDPQPYILNGKKVPCDKDGDGIECAFAAGGQCITALNFPASANQGFCYDPGSPYLEYRDNLMVWENEPPVASCVQMPMELRTWCEMPWSRGSVDANDPRDDLGTQINKDRKTKLHPPFWYDDRTGRCFVTRHYCMGSLGEGGYDSGYGIAKNYAADLLHDCKGSNVCDGEECQIVDGHDCCFTMEESFMQLIMGRTMSTWIKDIVAGNATPREMVEAGGAAAFLATMLSEDRLKLDRRVVIPDFIEPGVSLYTFRWSPEAFRTYPSKPLTHGFRLGLMASELQRAFPAYVHPDQHNNRIFSTPPLTPEMRADDAFVKTVVTLALLDEAVRATLWLADTHMDAQALPDL